MNRPFILFLTLITMLTLSSCHRDLSKGHYIKGTVIYRAESNFPVGLIKIEDIHLRDKNIEISDTVIAGRNVGSPKIKMHTFPPPIESPSRAVLYEFEETRPLNLYQEVWFKVYENGNYQCAQDIKVDKSQISGDSMTQRQKFFLLKKIKFNLHNGDKHREGPKHKRIHPVRNNTYSLQQNQNVALLRYNDADTGVFDSVFVRSSDVPLDVTRAYFIQFDVLIDTFRVHTLDLNHIH